MANIFKVIDTPVYAKILSYIKDIRRARVYRFKRAAFFILFTG